MTEKTPAATASASVAFPGGILLFIVLLLLKLGWPVESVVQDWSWWLITAPLWGPFALVLLGIFFVIFVAAAVN